MKSAIDIVLEGVSNGSINQDDAKVLLEAINSREVQVVPYTLPYQPTIPSQPYSNPGIWYTSDNTGTTAFNSQTTTQDASNK